MNCSLNAPTTSGDVGLRVLSILTGEELRQPEYKPNTILIAEDLTPLDDARAIPVGVSVWVAALARDER